jgi:hypothetical protein
MDSAILDRLDAGGELDQLVQGCGFGVGVGAGFDLFHDLGPMLHDLAWSVVRSPVSFPA